MNPIERESIQEMYNNFLTDLHIDPEFLGMLIQDKVLTTNIVGIIQAKPTQEEKIFELLQILPRCGQGAFQSFFKVLQARSAWLAEKLQQIYQKKLGGSQISQDLNNSENSDNEYDFESHSDIEENQLEIEIEDNDSEDEESSEISSEESSENSPANQSETLTDARRYSPIPRSAGSVAVRYQQKLNHLYVSLKCKLQKQEKREISFTSPEPATVQMIEDLHDTLLEKLNELQANIDRCSKALGSNNTVPLMSHIIQLKSKKAELEKDLKVSEEQRNKYCEQIMKLDLNLRNMASKLQINEEKLRNKADQEKEYKCQIQTLEDNLTKAEKRSTKLVAANNVWKINYMKLKEENQRLMREVTDYRSKTAQEYQSNTTNDSDAQDYLDGTQVNQLNENDDENELATPRPLQINNAEIKTEKAQIEKARPNQARLQRRERRHRDLSSLSYRRGSIQKSVVDDTPTKEQTLVQESIITMSEIKQMKLSLQNAQNADPESQDDSARKLLKFSIDDDDEEELSNNKSSKTTTPRMQPVGKIKQKFDYVSTEDQPRKTTSPKKPTKLFKKQLLTAMIQSNIQEDPADSHRVATSRKSFKKQTLLRTLSTKD